MTSTDKYVYTMNSTDPEHYNRKHASLDIPNTEYSVFQVAELTAKCSIIILNTHSGVIKFRFVFQNRNFSEKKF